MEALVALAIVAGVLGALGALVASTTRATRSLDARLAVVEIARALEADLPGRDRLLIGTTAGQSDGYRWRIDIRPVAGAPRRDASRDDDRRGPPPDWSPLDISIQVVAPTGLRFQLDTVRLQRRPSR